MSNNITYTQCLLVKENCQQQVVWIPTLFAKIGKIIDLRDKIDWNKGWEVKEVYGIRTIDELELMRQQDNDFKFVLG
jgi:hypothetical protein